MRIWFSRCGTPSVHPLSRTPKLQTGMLPTPKRKTESARYPSPPRVRHAIALATHSSGARRSLQKRRMTRCPSRHVTLLQGEERPLDVRIVELEGSVVVEQVAELSALLLDAVHVFVHERSEYCAVEDPSVRFAVADVVPDRSRIAHPRDGGEDDVGVGRRGASFLLGALGVAEIDTVNRVANPRTPEVRDVPTGMRVTDSGVVEVSEVLLIEQTLRVVVVTDEDTVPRDTVPEVFEKRRRSRSPTRRSSPSRTRSAGFCSPPRG